MGGARPRLSALTPASFDLWTLDSWECPDDKVFLGNFHLSIKSRQPRQPARLSSGGCHSLGQQWWRPTGVLLPRGSPLAAEPSPESRGRLLAGCAASPASCRARASGRRLTPVPPFADSDLEQMRALQSPVSSSAKLGGCTSLQLGCWVCDLATSRVRGRPGTGSAPLSSYSQIRGTMSVS